MVNMWGGVSNEACLSMLGVIYSTLVDVVGCLTC
jgi:hypothetical protein